MKSLQLRLSALIVFSLGTIAFIGAMNQHLIPKDTPQTPAAKEAHLNYQTAEAVSALNPDRARLMYARAVELGITPWKEKAQVRLDAMQMPKKGNAKR